MSDFIDNHLDKTLVFFAMVLFAAASVLVVKYYPTHTDLLRDMHDGLLSMTSIFGVLVYPRGKGGKDTNPLPPPEKPVA